MKITQQHPTRGDWSVLTATSAPHFVGPSGDNYGVIFNCYGISTKGDRIEYRLTLTYNELTSMARALDRPRVEG